MFQHVQGAPKNALSECCWSHSALAQTQVNGTPCVWKLIFGCFVLRLSLIKPSQVMFMVKFSATALNFDYDFVLLVHFLGHPVCIHKHKNANTPGYIQTSVPPNWNKDQLRKLLQIAWNFAHLCEILLKYEQYFVQSSNISCNWVRSFPGLTSVKKTELLGGLKS